MKKTYSIKHTLWYQEELTYEEDGRAKEVLKKLEAAFDGQEKHFGQILETLYDAGVVPDLFKVILKPYQPTPLHALWNRFWARWYHIDRNRIIGVMKNSEIAAVVADFFLFNTSWMGNSPPSSTESVGSLKLPTSLTSLFARTRSSTSSQREITTPASE